MPKQGRTSTARKITRRVETARPPSGTFWQWGAAKKDPPKEKPNK